VVSNLILPSFILHVHRSTGACTPTRSAPPPSGVGYQGHRNRRPFGSVVFTSTSATRRTLPWSKPWPNARFRQSPMRSPPRAASLRRVRCRPPLTRVLGRPIFDRRCGSTGRAGQIRSYRSVPGHFVYEPLVFFVFASRSSHL
jgi:hypothetical protein